MAVLAIAGAGALASSALGLGAGVGWLAGSVVANLLFPSRGPDVVNEGPRLGDLSVTSSAYGAPIAIGYGTLRMAGNVIWATPIEEEREVERHETGKGGGGGSVTQVGYRYYGNFAVAFGAGPAEDVLRVWADSKLIFDKTGTAHETAKPSLRFRFHPGDEDQLPDPLVEAHKGADAPAYRGLCYLVFERLPLADYGNRIPSISAEITYKRTPQKVAVPVDFITTGEGGLTDGFSRNALGVDWDRGTAYLVGGGVVRRIDLRAMREDRQSALGLASDPYVVGPDGAIYASSGASNSRPIHRVDPDTLQISATFGTESSGLTNTTTTFVWLAYAAGLRAIGLTGPVDFLLTGSIFDDVGLIKAPEMTYVWGAGQSVESGPVRGVAAGKSAAGFAEGWVADDGHNLYRLRVAANAAHDPLTGLSLGVEWTKVATLSGSGTVAGLYYDRTDDSVIAITSGGTIVKWRGGDGEVWTVDYGGDGINYDGPESQSRLQGQRLAFIEGTNVRILDTASGEFRNDPGWTFDEGEFGAQAYDSRTHSLLVITTGNLYRFFLDRGSGQGESLGAIVADLCARAGLDPVADVDVAELADTVPGYVVGRRTAARGALEPLAAAYFFDAVESDDRLAFRKRGRAKVRDVVEADLGALDGADGEPFRETRTQEVELPERVEVLYMDKAGDYQQGAQHDKRAALPTPSMLSREQARLELPLAMDAVTAKRIAQRSLYAAWLERSRHELRLPWRYLALEPTDVVDVVLDDGTVFPTRLVRANVNGDLSIGVEGLSEDAAVYVSTVAADAGAPLPQAIPTTPVTRLFLLDLPLLRDADDTGGLTSRVYFLMAGTGQLGWPGAVLYRSADGARFEAVGQARFEAAYGAALDALGDTQRPFATDETNTLRVVMTTGAEKLESVTQGEMLNGANAAVLGNEVIQFRDVAQNPDGSFTLSGLLRGRRGTELFTDGHQAGEPFLLLDVRSVETLRLDLAQVGASRLYKAVGLGQPFDEVQAVSRVLTGADLKPYAPVHLSAVPNAQDDVVISWVRRTRLGGEWRDGAGAVPLAEESEAYEVDVLDTPGGAVVRTLTSTVPTVTYLNTDIQADLGPVAWAPVALVNPGAEAGDTSGWTSTLGGLAVRTANPAPFEGAYYFMGGTAAETLAHQDVAVPAEKEAAVDSGLAKARVAWRQNSFAGADQAEMRLEFYDAALVQLGATVAAGLQAPSAWTARTLEAAIPAGTRTVRLVQRMVRASGNNNDGYIDAIALDLAEPIPLPERITFVVTQVSAAVGRGFGREKTVELP